MLAAEAAEPQGTGIVTTPKQNIPAILAVVVLAAVVQLVAQEIWMVSQEVLIPVVVEVAEEATLTLLQILADNGAVLEARAVPVSY